MTRTLNAFLVGAGLLAAPAAWAGNELSLELGSFGAHDPQWEHFSYNEQIGTAGVRAGYGLSDELSVVASWHRGGWGSTVEYWDDEDDWNEMGIALIGNQFAAGPKYELRPLPWLRPYGTVQAMGMRGRLLMDDDLEDDDNINQLDTASWAFGGAAALGLDFVPIRPRKSWSIGSHLEMGYGALSPMKLVDDAAAGGEGAPIGSLDFRGFYLRWGVGLRF